VFVVDVACVTPIHKPFVLTVKSVEARMPPKIALPVADTGPPPPIVPEWFISNVPTPVPVVADCADEDDTEQTPLRGRGRVDRRQAPDTAPNSGLVLALPSRAAIVYVPAAAAVVEVPDANRR
jgi:hypothetical protein